MKIARVGSQASTKGPADWFTSPAPIHYGVFGAWQRGRSMQDEKQATTPTYTGGSDHPTGRI